MFSVHCAFRYKWNTDKDVTVLKFTDLDGDGIGMLRSKLLLAPPSEHHQTESWLPPNAKVFSTFPHSWFAVHAVSMNYTNRMVSSDNMGYASYLMEQDKNGGQLPGKVTVNVLRIYPAHWSDHLHCLLEEAVMQERKNKSRSTIYSRKNINKLASRRVASLLPSINSF